MALAKANPGKYWFGSSGLGTITHLTGEVLTRAAGIKMQHAPYKTIVDATGDIFDGRIQMVFDPSFVPYAKAGKVRVVLIDAPTRLADLPDVPTAQEVGLDLKGFRDRAWFGLFAPKGLPPAIADRISDEVARIAATPDMKDKLLLVAQYAPPSVAGRLRPPGRRRQGLLHGAAEGARHQAGVDAGCTAAVRRTHRRLGHSRRPAE